MHFSIDLIVVMSPGLTRNTMIHLLWWLWKKKTSGSVFSWSFISRHTSKRLPLWFPESKRGSNFAASPFMWSSSVKIHWHELHETSVNVSNSSIVRRESNITSQIFWMFILVMLVEGRPDRGCSSSDKSHIWSGKPICKPLPGSKLLLWNPLESMWQFLLLFSPNRNKTWCKHVVLLSLPSKYWWKLWQRLKKTDTQTL